MSAPEAPNQRGSGVPVPPSKLPEYEHAATEFLWTTLNDLMFTRDPVLAQIQRAPTSEVPKSSAVESGRSEGTIGNYRPVSVRCGFVQTFDAIVNVDVDAWTAMVDAAAEEACKSLMPQIFAHMAEMADATGQTVHAKGRPFSVDLFLDMLDKLAFTFDEDGNPNMPTMVVSPADAAKIGALPPPTPEQLARHQQILERKKREFDASRRVRKLDRDS